MPFNEELPEWKKDNPDERPAQSKLDAGWIAGERPPAGMWNWFANRTYRALKQLFDFAVHKESKTLIDYATATGTKNVYAVTLDYPHESYKEGLGFSVKINVSSDAKATINVNGLGPKDIKKANGTDATNLKAGGIYTLRYDGTAFILQGEGGEYGNATAGDVLSGTTLGTESGVIPGTLALTGNAAVGDVLSGKTFYNTNAKAKQTGNIPIAVEGAYTTHVAGAPGTGDILATPPKGYYDGIKRVKVADVDFLPSNIKKGINLFGIDGTLDVTSLGGKKYATGVVMSDVNGTITVNGLDFLASKILAMDSTGNSTIAWDNFGVRSSQIVAIVGQTITRIFFADTDSYVNSTSFRLRSPTNTLGANKQITWIAIE